MGSFEIASKKVPAYPAPTMTNTLPVVAGWCSDAKRSYLVDWINLHHPKLIVELGVYGGSSLLPMALAAKEYGGKVIGVDPWSTPACLEGMESPENKEWWAKHSQLQSVRREFFVQVRRLLLHQTIQAYELTSDKAAPYFAPDSIDLLSIDGNHGPPAVQDGILYLPKLRSGALIACDDTDWEEGGVQYVRQMIDYLLTNGCTFLDNVDGCTMLRRD